MQITNFHKLRHLRQSRDFRFAGHRHPCCEANLILKGDIELTCDSSILCLHAGQFAVWRPDVFHMSRVLTSEGAELLALDFELSDPDFPESPYAVFDLDGQDLLLAELIAGECAADPTPAATRLLEAFLLRLAGRSPAAILSDSPFSRIYRTAVRFMHENLHQDFDAPAIARHCGVCLTNLKQAFSRCAGKGVKAYFLDLKLERAKQLLAGGAQVGETADALGFSSASYFSQCFRKKTGITPLQYRRAMPADNSRL